MGKPPKLYPESVADEIGSELDHLAATPKGLQAKELVSQMRPKIEAAQASGHTLEDIVGVFKGKGVKLTINTLKQYLRESKALSPAQRSKSARPKRPGPAPIEQAQIDTAASEPIKEEEAQLIGTNASGFQVMRDDDDL